MPFSDKEIESALSDIEELIWSKRRPPTAMRDKIREGQRISGFTIELFLARPKWNNPDEWIEESIAKIRYVKTTNDWRLYWKRADLKWHACPETPKTKTLREALRIVDADSYCRFWG